MDMKNRLTETLFLEILLYGEGILNGKDSTDT